MALNAATGSDAVDVQHVLGPDQGVRALGLGSGGAWETPLVGTDGSVTFGIGNPYQAGRRDRASVAAALHRQRREPRRRDREAALVLPGRAQRLQGLRHAGLADLGHHRRRPGRDRRRQDGLRLRDERQDRQAALEDTGRRAQRPRQRLAGAQAPARRSRCRSRSSRIVRRRADQPGGRRRHRLRGDDRPPFTSRA